MHTYNPISLIDTINASTHSFNTTMPSSFENKISIATYVPQPHIPQSHVPQSHVSQSHEPQSNVPQSHIQTQKQQVQALT